MLRTIQQALSHCDGLRVNTDAIGLRIALAVRSAPLLMATVEAAKQARLARGRSTSISALGVPVTARLARTAQGWGDALIVRGHDPGES